MACRLLSSFETMAIPILLSLGALYFAGALLLARCLLRAPRGREDSTGFHLEPDAEAEGAKAVARRTIWKRENTPAPAGYEGVAPKEPAQKVSVVDQP